MVRNLKRTAIDPATDSYWARKVAQKAELDASIAAAIDAAAASASADAAAAAAAVAPAITPATETATRTTTSEAAKAAEAIRCMFIHPKPAVPKPLFKSAPRALKPFYGPWQLIMKAAPKGLFQVRAEAVPDKPTSNSASSSRG